MADLLSILSLGANGIAAQSAGASVAANNIANANTAGFSRQRVDLESLLAAPLVGGVRSGDPTRYASQLLNSRIQSAAGQLSGSQAFSAAISDFEATATAGNTIDVQLGNVFTSLSQASAAPTDPDQRANVTAMFRQLADGIRQRAGETADARNEADARIGDGATQATALAKQLATLNAAVAKSSDPTLADQRDQVAKQLVAITGGKARIDADGMMRVALDGGAVLVDGKSAAQLVATKDPATGFSKLEVVDGGSRRDVTSDLGSGSLAGELKLRDVTLGKVAQQLDQLAFDTAKTFNTTAMANAAPDGTTGHAIFVQPAAVAGAAATFAIDPALDADNGAATLALAAPGKGPGDNTGAQAMFALANTKLGGKTLADSALAVIQTVAQAGADAKSDVARDTLVASHLDDLRDSLAGVDTQEELTNLARFQHASDAMTKVVSTIDSMLSSLIENL